MRTQDTSISRKMRTGSAFVSAVLVGILVAGGGTASGTEPAHAHAEHTAKKAAGETRGAAAGPRTLTGYVDQEEFFVDYLKKNHPIFAVYSENIRLISVRRSRPEKVALYEG